MSIVPNEDQASGAAGGHQEKKPLQGFRVLKLTGVHRLSLPGVCSAGTVFTPRRPFLKTPVSALNSMTVLLTSHHWCLSPHQPPYNLSCSEKQTMDRYINNLLSAGLIRLSSILLGAGFFFVEKKGKTCCPCIDYQGLNEM